MIEDVLSDVLRLVRLRSCVYFIRDFWSPWAMSMPEGRLAQFHAVVAGDCVVEIDGTCQTVVAGDVVLFPHGSAHVLADQRGRTAIPGPEAMRSFSGEAPCFVEGDKAARVVCGHYEYGGDLRHPVIQALPDLVHVRSFDALSPGSFDSILPLLVRELIEARPGSATVVERLAEILLVQVLRFHFEAESQPVGFLAGLSDPRIARSIRRIHSEWDRILTLDALADTAGMSRSAYAAEFKALTGETPVGYLTQWRLCRASELLTTANLSVAEIAQRVGYDSDISFTRAFKRTYGLPPAAYRRQAGSTASEPS